MEWLAGLTARFNRTPADADEDDADDAIDEEILNLLREEDLATPETTSPAIQLTTTEGRMPEETKPGTETDAETKSEGEANSLAAEFGGDIASIFEEAELVDTKTAGLLEGSETASAEDLVREASALLAAIRGTAAAR
jgi:hypothetical protein